MSQSLLPILIAGLVGGAAGAGATALVASPSSPSGAGTGLDGATTMAEVLEEVSALRDENRELHARVVDLELRPVPETLASNREAVETAELIERNREMEEQLTELRELRAALTDPSSGTSPALEATVETALLDIQERQREEREIEREQRRQERLEERIASLTQTLGLDAYQVDEMRLIHDEQSTKFRSVFTEARESGDFGGVRDTMRELRDESQARVESVLSGSQLEIYNELDRRETLFGGMGGFGGGGRGDRAGGDGGSGRRGI
jgi:cell division protein FtsB